MSEAAKLSIRLSEGASVTRKGRAVAVGGPRQRAVLALLAARPRNAVSIDALIDGVWGERPPDSAVKTVRAYLSRLRSVLGEELIRSVPAGYVLDVPDENVDAVAFEHCVNEARTIATREPERAASLLHAGLERQPPPVSRALADCPGVAVIMATLEERRLGAIELLMELQVALGHGGSAIAELSELVIEHPFRERFWAALMRALYQTGRHTEALATFQRVRRLLDDSLGLEPGPDLRELEAAILSHDPALAAGDQVPARPRHLTSFTDRGPQLPDTRYAKTEDGLHIAYQVVGDGPTDLLFFGPPLSHIELAWHEPKIAAFYQGLASFSRLILFDKRGVGMSDPVTQAATLAQCMDDARAVMDAAGSPSAVMFGTSEAGQLGVLMATTHPQRVKALACYGTFACIRRRPDYPIGIPEHLHAWFLELVERDWGGQEFLEIVIPSFASDPLLVDRFRTYARNAVSPGGAIAQFVRNYEHDIRDRLAHVTVPTLVMHAADELFIRADHGRYLAERVPGARYVEMPGGDHLPYGDNADAVISEIRTLVEQAARTSSGAPSSVVGTSTRT